MNIESSMPKGIATQGIALKVAVLSHTNPALEYWQSLLSEKEWAYYAAICHPVRQARWLSGRVAAKYLYLDLIHTNAKSAGWPPPLLHLSTANLEEFSPWMYRRVEVLSVNRPSRGYPIIHWDGGVSRAYISISHTQDMSSVCVGFSSSLGLDIETHEPKTPSFYRGNFTSQEKYWVTQQGNHAHYWLYTLLWTLKESVLKCGLLKGISIWNFLDLDIAVHGCPEKFMELSQREHLSGEMEVLDLSVTKSGKSIQAQAAFMGSRKYILSMIKTK